MSFEVLAFKPKKCYPDFQLSDIRQYSSPMFFRVNPRVWHDVSALIVIILVSFTQATTSYGLSQWGMVV